jgi:flavin-dependent dehydrogenase
MVAAINLARQGREVLVIEGEKQIGGMHRNLPSIHTTPIDPAWMSEQVGIDVTPAFHAIQSFQVLIGRRKYDLNPGPLHAVERGARRSGIDALLYDRACRAGVAFSFGTLLHDLREIPKGSIVATGLHPSMYDYLDIPFEIVRGFSGTHKTDREPWAAGMMAEYTNDYFYANCANRLMYGLFFSRGKVSAETLERCKRDAEEAFGLHLPKWEYTTGRVPTGSAKNPRLYQDGYILAGTLAGAMDPGALFGIHGALLSGKVAATAVDDPDRAIQAFRDMNRFYRISYYLRRFFSRVPGRLAAMDFNIRHPLFSFPMMALTSAAVPGYRHGFWNYEVMRSARKVAR